MVLPQRHRVGMTSFTVTASDGVTLRGVQHGDRAHPTVVLIHGFPDTARVWDEVVALLAPRYHVVTYDVRGAGQSAAPDGRRGYRFEQLAADLVAIADEVSPDGAVHVVGHDWGAIQAFEAATTEQLARRLASFTCISGASFDHAGRALRRHLRPSRHPLRSLSALGGQALRSWYVFLFQIPALPERVFATGAGARIRDLLERVEPRDGHPAQTLPRDGANGVNLYRANLRRVLRPQRDHVYVPIQVVLGDGDVFASPRLFDELAELAPQAWLRLVHGRHWLPRTDPALVARSIAEFVDHIEGGPAAPELRRAALRRHIEHLPDHGKVAVVTGAGNGIGRAVSIALAERGAGVALVDLDPEAVERTALFARHLGAEVSVHQADVSDAAAMEQLAKDVGARFGAPDIVVNNAGIGMAGPFLDTPIEEWERILGVNLWGVIHGCRLFARQMIEAGRRGHIVNLSSGLGYTPARDLSAYATSKAAVLMLSEVLRNELAPHGIGVSAICPGIVDTGITSRTRFVGTDEHEQERRRRQTSSLYQRRGYGPDRVAHTILAAIEHNRAVVPVTAEAHIGRFLGRLSPGLLRALARADVVGR